MVSSQIGLVVDAVNKVLNSEKIYLFGSHAKGSAGLGSDLDIAIIQEENPKIGQKAKIFMNLQSMGYDWNVEPDIHIFSKSDFEKKMKQEDLFVNEIAKGRIIYE